eukprot:1159114-Pelagomonas_calceolata.AAC.6
MPPHHSTKIMRADHARVQISGQKFEQQELGRLFYKKGHESHCPFAPGFEVCPTWLQGSEVRPPWLLSCLSRDHETGLQHPKPSARLHIPELGDVNLTARRNNRMIQAEQEPPKHPFLETSLRRSGRARVVQGNGLR